MSDTGKLEKAYLSLSEPSSSGGKKGGGPGKKIEFTFNPKEFTVQRSADWKAKTSKKAAMPEYVGTKAAAVSLEMFIDASEGGDVPARVEELMACVDPHKKTEHDKPSPPFVTFGWGSAVYLDKAVVKSVSVRYTRFASDGTPLRAVATISLEELKPATPRQNPTSGGVGALTIRTVLAGDTLASIAYQELGAATEWRSIARANGIDDPFRVRAGTRVMVPDPEVDGGR